MTYLDAHRKAGCNTVDMRATARGLVAGERFERFKFEAITEITLRAAGILMIMGSILMWFLLPIDPGTGRVASFGLMASLLAACGLGVFAYGTRGFRRQMTLDTTEGKLKLTKINIHEQARVSREITIGAIESVFLRRLSQPGGMATLLVRVAGSAAPAIALTGATKEVEEVHAELCAVLKVSGAAPKAAKPSLRLNDGRPKTRLFPA